MPTLIRRPAAARTAPRRPAPRRRNPSYDDLRLYRNVLTGPEGSIRLRKIGKGAFSVAYVEERTDNTRPRVFIFSDDGVYDKELLAMAHESAPRNPHLPAVERYGTTATQSVYTMPLYKAPLRKDDDPVGWRDYLVLKKCRDEAYAPAYGGPRNRGKTGYEINEDVYACAEAKGVRPSLLEALRALIDTAGNYGEAYVFEFSPRNLATHEGRLVLLDVLYDRDALQRRQTQARQKRGLVWNPKPLRRNPEDRAVVRELMDKLMDFKYAVMEASGEDPEYTRFDVNDYAINKYTLESYLDTKVLGWGATRVVVRLPSGNVAKLPWGDDEQETNVREWENWQEASPEVRRMLLPPLELIDGVIVFPRVVTEDRRDYDDPDLVAAREEWTKLWNAHAPGAKASDFHRNSNWGTYEGRLVLIDYAD